MNTHTDKTQENKSQSVANETSQMRRSGKSSLQFVDNRPEAVAQRKLQEMANNSPQVSQLREFQETADEHLQVKLNGEQVLQRFVVAVGKKNLKYYSSYDKSKKLFDDPDLAEAYDRELEEQQKPKAEAPSQEQGPEVVQEPVVVPAIDDRTKRLGVKLGEGHKLSNTKRSKRNKRKTTARVEERATRHMNAAIKGEPSKARRTGARKGQDYVWELDRATKEKQDDRGPRHILQHPSEGRLDDPIDYFEDRDYGSMSETDEESESDLD